VYIEGGVRRCPGPLRLQTQAMGAMVCPDTGGRRGRQPEEGVHRKSGGRQRQGVSVGGMGWSLTRD
jgi:hypothetical protein